MPMRFPIRPSFALAGLLCALAACSTEPLPVPDAGTTNDPPDASSGIDAGPRVNQPIGAACAEDGECRSGHCNRQTPDGACIQACSRNAECPAGSVCELVTGTIGYCVALCTADGSCVDGYHCPAIFDVCLPNPGCETNADCPGQRTCNRATGLCAGALGGHDVGGSCDQTSDCTQGPRPFCIGQDQGFQGGYCSSFCRKDEDCGEKNFCMDGLTGPNGFALCLAGCTADTDCRDGMGCAPLKGKHVCVPPCRDDSDCGGNGSTCDTNTGHCTEPDQPDAGTELDAGTDVDAGTEAVDAGTDVDAGTGEVDAGTPYSGPYPAPRQRPPQVVNSGGPVLAAPHVVPVFFANDDADQVTALADFDARVGATDYWAESVTEYGVGPLTADPAVHLAEIATGTVDDTDIQRWLKTKLKNHELPAPDENTLYALHYPKSLNVLLQGQRSCQTFGGYHSNFRNTDGTQIVYAVLPRCERFGGGGNVLDIATNTESHEFVEAATDPYPFGRAAFQTLDDSHLYWVYVLGGGETSDMCAQDHASTTRFDELPYSVQRNWSNAAARAGHDPCVPALPGTVFFNAVPEHADALAFDVGGASVQSLGTIVAPGTSRTIDLDLYSDADTGGPWTVTVLGGAGFGSSDFAYALDRNTGRNGDHLKLTLTAKADARDQDIFAVVSKLGTATHVWYGLVSPQ